MFKSWLLCYDYSLACVNCCNYTVAQKAVTLFSFHYRFYKCQPISMIFGTNYTELICNTTVIDLPTLPMYCCCTTLEKLIFCFWLSSPCVSDDELLQCETPKFIYPDLWLPNSPDLNPVNYRIWGVMQDRVYQTPVRDLADLRQRLIDTWNDAKHCGRCCWWMAQEISDLCG